MLEKKYILYVLVLFVGIHVTFIKQFPQLSPWLKIIHSSIVCWSVLQVAVMESFPVPVWIGTPHGVELSLVES